MSITNHKLLRNVLFQFYVSFSFYWLCFVGVWKLIWLHHTSCKEREIYVYRVSAGSVANDTRRKEEQTNWNKVSIHWLLHRKSGWPTVIKYGRCFSSNDILDGLDDFIVAALHFHTEQTQRFTDLRISTSNIVCVPYVLGHSLLLCVCVCFVGAFLTGIKIKYN